MLARESVLYATKDLRDICSISSITVFLGAMKKGKSDHDDLPDGRWWKRFLGWMEIRVSMKTPRSQRSGRDMTGYTALVTSEYQHSCGTSPRTFEKMAQCSVPTVKSNTSRRPDAVSCGWPDAWTANSLPGMVKSITSLTRWCLISVHLSRVILDVVQLFTTRCSALGDFGRCVGFEYGSQKSCASSFPPRTASALSRRRRSLNARCHFDKRMERRDETEKMLRDKQERGNGANICAFLRLASSLGVAMSNAGRCNETQPTAPSTPCSGAIRGEEILVYAFPGCLLGLGHTVAERTEVTTPEYALQLSRDP